MISKYRNDYDLKRWRSQDYRGGGDADGTLRDYGSIAPLQTEVINRIDDTVVFDALNRGMDAIFKIQMKRVDKLLSDRQLSVTVTDSARTALCDAGFDPLFGARPLKRSIQQYLLNPMSKAIVSGGYGRKTSSLWI